MAMIGGGALMGMALGGSMGAGLTALPAVAGMALPAMTAAATASSPSLMGMLGPALNTATNFMGSSTGQRALGMGLAGLAGALGPGGPRQFGREYIPYGPPSEFEEILGGEMTERSVERLQDAFNRMSDLSQFGVENLRTSILPTIFDADPTQDPLRTLMPGSSREFDVVRDARRLGLNYLEDQLEPFMAREKALMGDISPRMMGLHPLLETAARDPYSLSETARTTVADIQSAARARLQALEDVERKKVMERAHNQFGPDADLNVYLTQMMDPFARQTAIGRAQLEQTLAQQRLAAGLQSTQALQNIYGTLGTQYGSAANRFLQAGQQVPLITAPMTRAAGDILKMRGDLLGRGLDIKRDFADYTKTLATAFDPLESAANLALLRQSEVKPMSLRPAEEQQPSLGAEMAGLGSKMAFQTAKEKKDAETLATYGKWIGGRFAGGGGPRG